MPATITITQQPNTVFDMAYGPNPITLSGLTPTEDKYVLRVFGQGGATPIADIRQTPNQYGKAIFDLQNILQSHVKPPLNTIDSLGVGPQASNSISNTNEEQFTYTLAIGYEVNGIVTMNLQGYGPYTVYGGSKQYFEVPFDTTRYQSEVSSDAGNCTVVHRVGRALTDVQWMTGPASTGDNIQNYITINQEIATRDVYRDDHTTVTWFQNLERQGGTQYPVKGIEAWKIMFMGADGNRIGNTSTVPNITSWGGGPNSAIGNGFSIPASQKALTLATGPYNLPAALSVPANCTHYYVIPVAYTCTTNAQACDPQTQVDLDCQDLMQAQRFNIIEDTCNDFAHTQFSWYNSLGFKDYFTFTKRSDHQTKTKHNNFLKEAADYNSSSWSVSEEDRGFTTYSSKIEDIYTVTSGYMNDDQAKLLRTLFQSSDAMVRQADSADPHIWRPINILSATWNEKTNRKDRLFQYTVRFKIAHNIKAQRG